MRDLTDAEGVRLPVEFEMKCGAGPPDAIYEVPAAPKEESGNENVDRAH